ncbi:MAG: symmetrical bis(5'-nucleosyl)-tetraphosphatase [Gammaproteobacteria bacterium]|nr:symmetrical bis(5'-nucleosyl)-tetraphosphatase [Gammaproteobacteria bacterium]
MAVYAIGDVQGCYSGLIKLLEKIEFDQRRDRLWFCGDLVNRGPESLQTLRFIRSLGDSAICVLGNHDLHLLAAFHLHKKLDSSDSLYQVLTAYDCDELLAWLQTRPLVHYDAEISWLMVHAGIYPGWRLEQVLSYAGEVESVLRGSDFPEFFSAMYGDEPDIWSDELTGAPRLRCITNILTRMRYFDKKGKLEMDAKGSPHKHQNLIPWFEVKSRAKRDFEIVFGHWSTLPIGAYGRHYAIDGGCVWGGKMVALRLVHGEKQWYTTNCQK